MKPGDRVVIPFNISCGHCFMCDHGLQSQCETTQNRDQGTGAALFGYSKLYGEVAGGQAEYLRVPQAQYTHIKVPDDGPDERYVYLSDVLPTAWQAVEYADVPDGGTLVVLGLGPIGSMVVPHRLTPQGLPGDRRRPRRRATGPRARLLRRCHRPAQDEAQDIVMSTHRRTWCRLGDRRGRDGGPRIADRRSGPDRERLPARRRWVAS